MTDEVETEIKKKQNDFKRSSNVEIRLDVEDSDGEGDLIQLQHGAVFRPSTRRKRIKVHEVGTRSD
jgi:hypothetical protein